MAFEKTRKAAKVVALTGLAAAAVIPPIKMGMDAFSGVTDSEKKKKDTAQGNRIKTGSLEEAAERAAKQEAAIVAKEKTAMATLYDVYDAKEILSLYQDNYETENPETTYFDD